ncbi:MAG: hypothetical protein JWP45_663 [Mucilaginibacter sp.]|nr:hypothetical protein [Mucilaginibacter sp.]
MYSPSYTDEIFDILVSQINESARASRSMIIEGMFLTNKTRSRILDLFNILTLKIVYVTADLLTLQARLLSRSEEGSLNVLHRKVPLKKEDLAKFYVNSVPPKDKSLIIDTTNDGIYVSLLSAEQIASRKFSYEFLLENLILHND